MGRKGSQGHKGTTRRRILLLLGAGMSGAGAATVALDTDAYTRIAANRSANINVSGDADAIVGLVINNPVSEGVRQNLVDITNRTAAGAVAFTVSLNDPTQGTLYAPSEVGDSVTVSVSGGGTDTVEIEPENITAPGENVAFSVSASEPVFGFNADRSTFADANNPNAIDFSQLQGYEPQPEAGEDNWFFKQVQAQDNDGDSDLQRVEYSITDESGGEVATLTETTSEPYFTASKYQRQKFTVEPDDPGYDVIPCELYTARISVFDSDSNVASRVATGAEPSPSSPIEIKKIQGFEANPGSDNWTIDQVQIQDKGDKDLSEVVYEVYDPVGNLVARDSRPGNYNQQYQESNITISPDDPGYDVVSGLEYTVKVSGIDASGNEGCDTRTA